MYRILNGTVYIILTERNVNRVEMRTEQFLVKEHRVRKRDEVGTCEVHYGNSFRAFKKQLQGER